MRPNSSTYFETMYPLVEDMSEIYGRPLSPVCAIFLFAIEKTAKAQPSQHTITGAHAGRGAPHRGRAPLLLCAEEVEPWLTTQWQTAKQHVLLAEDKHINISTCVQPYVFDDFCYTWRALNSTGENIGHGKPI